MENENLSKLLITYRKEKNLTQKELGDMLGVSHKTISKWECGNGLPDVLLLNKLSQVLGISVDDLLKGKRKKENNRKKYMLYITIVLILIFTVIIIIKYKKDNSSFQVNETYPCIAIGNYYIKLINNSNDENYKYITITVFQMEGVYSIKIPSSIANSLEVGKRYKIALKTKENLANSTPDALFANGEIINIAESKEDEIWTKYSCLK